MTDTPLHQRLRRLALLSMAVTLVWVVGIALASGTEPAAAPVDPAAPRLAPDGIARVGP